MFEGGFQTVKSVGAVGAAGVEDGGSPAAVMSRAMSRGGGVSLVAMVRSWTSSSSADGKT